ncbi:MAG: sigma-54-dependent transcriptional regulator [bacterium]
MSLGILIVEDQKDARELLEELLENDKHYVITAKDRDMALAALKAGKEHIDVIILDLFIPARLGEIPEESNAFNLLEYTKENFSYIEVIVLTAHDDVELVVKSIKLGAYDYLTKPLKLELLRDKLKKISDYLELKRENIDYKQRERYKNIIGRGKDIYNVIETMDKIADSDIAVLIEGETGTGKELIARAIHNESHRKGKFVAINCAAIPGELLESELFGHEKGAFTGANIRKIGCFEEANEGTLFLDEIGEMEYNFQAKLLRALETGRIRSIGGRDIAIDTRIVSATNQNIEELIRENRFRQDLYFRLKGIKIYLPPLRKRGMDDIALLAKHFLDEYCNKRGIPKKDFSKKSLKKLSNYNYPGNIRELKNIVRLSVDLNKDKEELDASDLKIEASSLNLGKIDFDDLFYLSLKDAKEEFEIKYLKYLLSTSATQTEAAAKAKMDKANFSKLVKKYNLING